MSSAKGMFYLFPSSMGDFIYIFHLIAVASRTFNTMLNRSGVSGILSCTWILQEVFQLLTALWDAGCGFLIDAFIILRHIPSKLCWELFSWTDVQLCQTVFLHLLR